MFNRGDMVTVFGEEETRIFEVVDIFEEEIEPEYMVVDVETDEHFTFTESVLEYLR